MTVKLSELSVLRWLDVRKKSNTLFHTHNTPARKFNNKKDPIQNKKKSVKHQAINMAKNIEDLQMTRYWKT